MYTYVGSFTCSCLISHLVLFLFGFCRMFGHWTSSGRSKILVCSLCRYVRYRIVLWLINRACLLVGASQLVSASIKNTNSYVRKYIFWLFAVGFWISWILRSLASEIWSCDRRITIVLDNGSLPCRSNDVGHSHKLPVHLCRSYQGSFWVIFIVPGGLHIQ